MVSRFGGPRLRFLRLDNDVPGVPGQVMEHGDCRVREGRSRQVLDGVRLIDNIPV